MKNNQKKRGPSPQKTEKTRAAIVEAARDEFISFGYSAGKTDRICKNAGVSRGTLYSYFSTKESLFESVLQEFITAARGELLAQQRKPDEKIKDFLCRVLIPVMVTIETSNRAQIARLVIMESMKFPALAQAYVREVYLPLLDEFKRLIDLAIEEGELKNDRLARFPQLLLAPNWMGMIFNGMLSPSEPMDIAAMFEANIHLLFDS
ncbi:TPA: TetR/AcrR family transcriptional regulator [Klebsiella pneumoniae]|nr:TetR/AcrR family transcriptional regulator [Klebsiella pneumoniae]